MSLQNFPSFFLDFSERHMEGENARFYGFGKFRLNVAERRLSDSETPISLTPKAFDVLSLLVQRAGHLIEKEELMKQVWPDSFVEEANVARIIHTLRKKLGDDGNGNSFIETVPTKGYRFVARVRTIDDSEINGGIEKPQFETANIEGRSSEAQAIVTIEAPAQVTSRRHFWVPAVIALLMVLVTGFWVSNGSLLPRTLARLGGHSMNGEAYRHFQAGKLLLEDRRPEDYDRALEHFEKAIELDPEYAEAYAGKADVRSYQFIKSKLSDDMATARAAAKKALELDPDNSYAHTVQCRILGTFDWEFEEAISECRRAVALGPNDDRAHRELGFALNVVGRSDEASSEMNAAANISPTSFNKRSLGMVLYMSRRYDEAIEQLLQVEATDPGITDARRWLMSCFLMKGDQVKSFEYLINVHESFGASSDDVSAVKSAFDSGGWPAALRATLNSSSGVGKQKSLLTAALYAQMGEGDRAFEILDDLRKERAIMRIAIAREPMLDPVRDDPRFETILSEMKLK